MTRTVLYHFFLAILLILGLLNPASGSLIDLFIGFFIFSFVSYVVLQHERLVISLAFTIAWIIFSVTKGFELIIIYGSLAGLATAILFEKYKFLKISAIFLLIFLYLISSWLNSENLRAILTQDLSKFAYNNDPGLYLKTYYFMGQNLDYYDSYKMAFLNRFEMQVIPKDVCSWRLPTLFVIWQLMPGKNGLYIYYLFLLLASLVLYTAYNIGKKYLGVSLAILPAYLIFPYLHFAARDQMFLITEWWSMPLFVFGVYLLTTRKFFWATLMFSLTLMIRELYILPIVLMLIYSFFTRRKIASVFIIPIFAFLVLFFSHVYRLSFYIDSWGTIFSPRIVSDGLFFIQQTLAFGSWEYLLFQLRPFLFFFFASILGCLYILRSTNWEESILWILAYLPFTLAFLRFGQTPFNDYWGIVYVPIAIILAPLLLGLFKQRPKV